MPIPDSRRVRILRIAAIAVLPGLLGPGAVAARPAAERTTDERGAAHDKYVCPMHPDVTSATPGTCPRCHMVMVAAGRGAAGAGAAAGYRVEIDATPHVATVGQPVRLRLAVRNAANAIVRQFAVVHDKRYHLFVISRDLESFEHVHPRQQRDGSWVVDVTPTRAGRYTIYSDFLPIGGPPQVVALPFEIAPADTAAAASPSPARLVPDASSTKTVGALAVTLDLPPGGLVAGRASALTYRLAHAATGAAITDLQPYLGAWGHTVILREDATQFVHAHPAEHPEPGAAAGGGPTLTFNARWPEAGTYRIWTQVQRQGEVITLVFTVTVAPAAPAAAAAATR